MYEFKRSLVSLLGILTLIAIAIATFPRNGRSASGPSTNAPTAQTQNVNVVNTPGVNAQQSGTWNVGINGTPTVGIDGLNNVVKMLRAPENPARQPIAHDLTCFLTDLNDCSDPSPYSVPIGKELVIEHVSMYAQLDQPAILIYFHLDTTTGGKNGFTYLAPSYRADSNNGQTYFMASLPMRMYADPSTTVNMRCQRDSLLASGMCKASFYGYLVDVP